MLEIKNPETVNRGYDRRKANSLDNYQPAARIVVVGVGGAGNNAVNRMITDNVLGVEFVCVNTDKQDLAYSKAPVKIPIGEKLTGGRGCGSIPEIGEGAANESKEAIRALFRESNNQAKADMVFITCGMGGGTGTGAAPVIAQLAKEEGILTVAVVTKPFRFEGRNRMTKAVNGINKLYPNVDTLIIIPNDKLFQVVDAKDGFVEAFAKADETLKQSIKGITDLINLPALVNLDFADISTVMRGKGLAHIAIGEGTGEDRVLNAIKKAMDSPLLETSIDGATDLIVCISGKVSIMDVDAAMRDIEPKLNPDVNIIFGAREDEELKDSVSITLIATGIRDTNQQNGLNINNNRRLMPNNQNMYQANINDSMRMQNQNFNLDYMNLTNKNQQNINLNQNNQQKTGFASIFSKKNNQNTQSIEQNVDVIKHDTENQNIKSTTEKKSNLDVDLSKIGFLKEDDDSNSLLPNFITDNFKKH